MITMIIIMIIQIEMNKDIEKENIIIKMEIKIKKI